MLKKGDFKISDLIKIEPLGFDETMTHLLSHIVRSGGSKEKLTLIRQSLFEIDQFLVECLSEQSEKVN